MPQPVVVVLNFCGCSKLSRTMVILWTKFPSYVTMKVPSRLFTTLVSIDIRHHFLRDHAIKWDIVISHVRTNKQLANIFTKPLDEKRFWELRSELNIIDSQDVAWKVAHLKCLLSCQDLGLQFFENSFLCSFDDFIANRFMLAFIMLISFKYALYANWQISFKILSTWSLYAKLWSIDQVISIMTF
jgi:hypothetical protein